MTLHADRRGQVPATRRATPPEIRLTWGRLVRLEPRLAAVLVDAEAVDPGDDKRFCANRVWYGRQAEGGLRGRLYRLVGWGRRGQPGVSPALATSEAYDVAYRRVYDALPACRECGCL